MVTVRDYRQEDDEAIASLLCDLGHPAVPSAVRERAARICRGRNGDRILVAVDGSTVAGLLTLHFTPVLHRETDVARVTALVVAPSSRRLGIGTLLMCAAERIAVREGATRIELTSGPDRSAAHQLYRRLGYHDEGIRFAKIPGPRI